MAKDRSGIPRFLFSSNAAVNDDQYILHTREPKLLIKIYKDGEKLKALTVMLLDQANPEQIENIEQEAIKKFLYSRPKTEN